MCPLSISQIHPHPSPLLPSNPLIRRCISVHSAKISSSLHRRRPLQCLSTEGGLMAPRRAAAARVAVKAFTSEEAFVKNMVASHDIVIFSKSYCPYCARAKSVFKEMNKDPFIVELDQREDGQDIQVALGELVGKQTVPQVFIKGEHLGDSDATVAAYKSGKLANLLSV